MDGFENIWYRIQEATSYLFTYTEDHTLVFSNSHFWFFFAGVLLVVHFYRDKVFYRNLFLVVFSLFFYYKIDQIHMILLIISTCTDYYLGKEIYRYFEDKRKKTLFLVLSLVVNLGLLGYFKYSFFIVDSVNYYFGTDFVPVDHYAMFCNNWFGTNKDIFNLVIPVGISFYTFQTLSYSIDLYRGKIKPVNNMVDFAFYVTYFPQLVAGPIVRANEFIPQIYEKYNLTKQEFGYAISLILGGLIKKIFIADYLATAVIESNFLSPLTHTGAENLMGVYGYALQIYGDFSGYSDMAIGLALVMGFRLNMNFNSPYRALSITDFWRRWHISLSSWLRDYLYIPLGGNRGTSIFPYIFIPIVAFFLIASNGLSISDLIFFPITIVFWLLYLTMGKDYPKLSLPVLGALLSYSITLIIEDANYAVSYWYIYTFFVIVTMCWAAILIWPGIKKELNTYVNLELTMFLGGIWHGPSINFIIWGALHGFALAINKLWSTLFKTDVRSNKWFDVLSWVLTFHFVLFCWIFFRAKDYKTVEDILHNIFYNFGFEQIGHILYEYRIVLLVMAFGFAIHFFPKERKVKLYNSFGHVPDLVKAIVIVLVVLICYQMRTSGIQPFIYFQF